MKHKLKGAVIIPALRVVGTGEKLFPETGTLEVMLLKDHSVIIIIM